MKYLQLIKNTNAFAQIKSEFVGGIGKHAYLIQCADANFGIEFACVCAALALCPNGGCLECARCKSVFSENHTDFFRVPQSGKINVKSVTDMLVKASIRGLSGKQAFVVDCTTALRDDWQNKLLKTLEEPLENNFLFLVSLQASQLRATIRSRASLLILDLPKAEDITKYFAEKGYVENLDLAASLCEGKIGYCEKLLQTGVLKHLTQSIVDAFANLSSSRNALECIAQLSQYREVPQILISLTNSILSDALALKTNSELLLIKDFRYDILKVANNFSCEALAAAIEIVNSQNLKLEQNFSFAMVLDEMIMKITEAKIRCPI